MASIQLGGSVGTTGTPILGAVTIVNLDATYTLSVAEYTNNYITVTGTLTAQRNIVAPLTLGVSYIVNNLTTGGQNVQFIGSSGTGVVIASGTRAMVVTDGTNYNLVAGSTTNFSAGGDLSGTNTSQQVISLTGAGGVINVASTGNIITWDTATTSPGLKQTDQTANSTNGQALKIQAQNSTGTSTVGGQLILASGTGTSASGGIFLNSGTSSLFSGDTGSITLNTGTNLNLDIGGTPKLVISSSAYTLSSLAGSGAGYVGVSNTGVLSFSSTANPGGTAGGDLSGTYPNPSVVKLQGNPIQSGILGSGQDGYVLTWINSSNQFQVQPTSTTIVDATDYQFANVSSDVSGYDNLSNTSSGSEADLTAAVTTAGGKTLIKAFATLPSNPNVNIIPAGIWSFNFYSYVSVTGAFTTNLIFDVYTRTSGGSETLLFTATSANLTVTSIGQFVLNYNNPNETSVPATNRVVVKVSAQTTSITSVTAHFVFDGTTHASFVETPIGGASLQLGGDLSGTTANAVVTQARGLLTATTTVSISGATAPTSGQALVATSGTAASWSTITATGTAGGDLSGTYPNPTVAKIQTKTLASSLASIGASQDGYILTWVNGSSDWEAKPVAATAIVNLSGDVTGTTGATVATQARGLKSATTTVSVSAATAPSMGQVLTATNSTTATWAAPSSAPTGTAGGDLTGSTYPNPFISSISGSGGTGGTVPFNAYYLQFNSAIGTSTATRTIGFTSVTGVGVSGCEFDILGQNTIGTTGGSNITAGNILIQGGSATSILGFAEGGDVTVQGGNASASTTGSGLGGTIYLKPGIGAGAGGGSSYYGSIFLGDSSITGSARISLLGFGPATTPSYVFNLLGAGLVHSTSGGVLSSSAVNLAGADVTGVLPIANQASQTMLGDVTGTTAASSVVKIQGKTLASSLASVGATQDGYSLTWVNANNDWEAKPAPSGSFVAGGDLSGSSSSQNVNAIHSATTSVNVSSATAPTTGQVLTATSSTAATWQTPSGGGGGLTAPVIGTIVTKTASYSIATTDYIILCNNSGAINLTLPTPVAGNIYVIKDIAGTANTNNITIVRSGTEQIEGVAASYVFRTNWGRLTLTSNGTNWFIIG